MGKERRLEGRKGRGERGDCQLCALHASSSHICEKKEKGEEAFPSVYCLFLVSIPIYVSHYGCMCPYSIRSFSCSLSCDCALLCSVGLLA